MDEHIYHRFEGYLNDCKQCSIQQQCMRKPATDRGRQVSIRVGEARQPAPSLLKQMLRKSIVDKDDIFTVKALARLSQCSATSIPANDSLDLVCAVKAK